MYFNFFFALKIWNLAGQYLNYGTPVIHSCATILSHYFINACLYQQIFGHSQSDKGATQKILGESRANDPG